MECLRCGANLKDNALVCKKCGFIVKGAKKLENVEPPVSFEDMINNASAEELRAMIFAYKKAKEAPKEEAKSKKDIDPEKRTIRNGKRWATVSFLCGLLAIICMVVPGINVIASLVLFLLSFMGFGQCAGQRSNLALTGVILSIVAICGSWVYNAYFAETVGQLLGLAAEVAEEGAEVVAETIS